MQKINSRIDSLAMIIIFVMMSYSVFLLTKAWLSGVHIGEWIWDRHQNQFSWYSRPLFIIPACYYAYRQKLGFIICILVLLGTSLFWFAPPVEVSETISGYLDWEREAFMNPDNRKPLIVLGVAVFIFLFLLFYAFWHRNYWIGLIVLNIGNLLKIAVSVVFGGDAGMASIVPTLSSLLILNILAFIIWKYKSNKDESNS